MSAMPPPSEPHPRPSRFDHPAADALAAPVRRALRAAVGGLLEPLEQRRLLSVTGEFGGTDPVTVAAERALVAAAFATRDHRDDDDDDDDDDDGGGSSGPSDDEAPTGTISVANVTTAGGTSHAVSVVYTDNVAVNAGSIGPLDLVVQGPGGDSLLVTSGVPGTTSDGSPVSAAYTVRPPGDTWDSTDNGTYTVSLGSNQVRDTSDNGAVAATVSFQVDIPAPDATGPAAGIAAPDVTAAGTTTTVTVTYTDDGGVDAGSIGADDLSFTSPAGIAAPTVNGVTTAGSGTSVTATYTVLGPGGSFVSADNGTYTVTVNAGGVRDLAGNGNAAASQSFAVNIPPPADTAGPAVEITAANVTAHGGGRHTITVNYSDAGGINRDSIDAGDVTVSGPGGDLNVSGVDVGGSGGFRAVTYTVDAPGGSWDAADNGTYTVRVNAGAVTDAAGNGNAEAAAPFTVGVSDPDTGGPSVSISAGDITAAGGATHAVSVTYADPAGIDEASIGTSDLVVSGPGGNLNVSNFSIAGGGTSRTVTYTIDAPGGSWDSADNGAYTVRVVAGAVRDGAGNGNAEAGGTFGVGIVATPPPDGERPVVASFLAGNVNSPGGTSHTVTVVFTDNVAVDVGTISAADLTVARRGGGPAPTVRRVDVDPQSNAGTVTATFTLEPPGGSWDPADNGTYDVLLSGEVRDTAGNVAAAAGGSFGVDATLPDTTGPAAAIAVANVITAGGQSHTVTVTFTDDTAVDISTIDEDDVTVSRPGGGSLRVRSVSVGPNANAGTVTATYTFDAPRGGWESEDNGDYTVTLKANEVRDTAGNAAAGASRTFNVQVPVVGGGDTEGPSASISVGDVTASAGSHAVSVTYTDAGGIDAGTLGLDDITVSRPGGGNLTVSDFDVSGSGNSVTVTYTVSGPGGSFDFADNGTYTVAVNGAAVRDQAGNAASGAGRNFAVNVARQDGSAPTVSAVSSPGIVLPGGTSHVVTVTYSDDLGIDPDTVGPDDISVFTQGGSPLPVGNVGISSAGGGTVVTVTYTLTPPNGAWDYTDNGTYTVRVNANAVRDLSGKGVAANAGGSFVVDVPDPGPNDPDFGGGRGVLANFTAEAITLQPDGKILVAGREGNLAAGTAKAVLQRFNADGSVDTSFGNGGAVVSTAGGNDVYYAVAVRDGNRIIVAGTRGGDFVVAAYDFAGRPDPAFGDGGSVRIDLGSGDEAAYGLGVAADGRVVLGGSSGGNFAFARLRSGGDLDFTFAQGGKQLFDMGGADQIGAVAVYPDGRVVAAGSTGTSAIVLRLGADGEADLGFSGDGVLVIPGLAARQDTVVPDRSLAIAIQADGKVIVANRTADSNFGLVRIDPAGNVDSGFGNGGLAAADFGGEDDADAVIVQETGQILAVGTTFADGKVMTGIAAFDSAGVPITAFGDGGVLKLENDGMNPGREQRIGTLVLRAFGTRQADGRLVIGTSDQSPTPGNSLLRRLPVPGATAQPQGDKIGDFGLVDGKTTKLTFTDDDGTVVTFTLKGGSATAFRAGDKVRLVINADGGRGATLSLKGRGGDGRVNLADVMVNGSLRGLTGKTADLWGTLFTSGAIGKLALADVKGGVIAAAGGSLGSLSALSLDRAYVLSGASLGTDGKLGGTGADRDTFVAGSIGTVKVRGSITGCVIGAGLDPTDGVFLDGDDVILPGGSIRSISAKGGADDATRICAASVRSASLPKRIKSPAEDERFDLLQ